MIKEVFQEKQDLVSHILPVQFIVALTQSLHDSLIQWSLFRKPLIDRSQIQLAPDTHDETDLFAVDIGTSSNRAAPSTGVDKFVSQLTVEIDKRPVCMSKNPRQSRQRCNKPSNVFSVINCIRQSFFSGL